MLRSSRLVLLLAFAVFASSSDAQQKAAAVDPDRVAAAKDLFVAMGSDAQFKTVIDTMTTGMASVVKQQQPGKAKDIDDVFRLLRDKFNARSSEVVEMVAPLWADKFSLDELKQIEAFYNSPIGKKMIAAQPEIMQRSMQMGMAWGQRIGAEVEAEARSELKKRGIDL